MDMHNFAKTAQTAFNARDIKTLATQWADDLEYLGPDGAPVTGKEHSIAREEAIWAGVPDIKVSLTCFTAEGDRGVLQGTMSGTHTGTLSTADGTFPPTGKKVVIDFVALFDFENGLAKRERVYYDRAALAAQLTGA
ncbi:ester cyclase [Parvibaculum sp.]|jgi:steroid delta-isomerase-like uncharacterized protein|uniref:ester cyclase n=1 Tax=Parvibaculum sp. TaxID=2024848 RepID=UPI001B16F36B|nr:ester cyclase [Parvibaculum sp.]MBO6633917.1 ester cyclase [Parvibaculum sp.]MBO6679688.1 ester cyclase [Parvibaculum sp.]MBO6684703.1 ester cyclase [Parvibaculum sp.]